MEKTHFSDMKAINKKLAVGIGKFDGMHLGHQEIVRAILSESAERNLVPTLFTFRNFPVRFSLYGWEEKIALLTSAGIKLCIWCDYEDVSRMSPEAFLDALLAAGAEMLVVGYNFRFGAGRSGGTGLLQKASRESGFELLVVPPLKIEGRNVNSSEIRSLIEKGDIARANKLLGRLFSVTGSVVPGSRIGRTLGFPTANLALDKKVSMGSGIYAGWTEYRGQLYMSALNIGHSPTFGDSEKKFEVYLIGFKGSLYGSKLKIYIAERIRDIRKFSGSGSLKEQISKDVERIENILESGGKPF